MTECKANNLLNYVSDGPRIISDLTSLMTVLTDLGKVNPGKRSAAMLKFVISFQKFSTCQSMKDIKCDVLFDLYYTSSVRVHCPAQGHAGDVTAAITAISYDKICDSLSSSTVALACMFSCCEALVEAHLASTEVQLIARNGRVKLELRGQKAQEIGVRMGPILVAMTQAIRESPEVLQQTPQLRHTGACAYLRHST